MSRRVAGHAGRHPGAAPTSRALASVAGHALLVALAVAAVLLLGEEGADVGPARAGTPVEVAPAQLAAFASSGRLVYWASLDPQQGFRLELTETAAGDVFVRYLTRSAEVGDRRPAFTVVGTYPVPGAGAVVSRRAREGWERRRLPGGGLVVWRGSRPSSVFLADPAGEHLVEVHDPRSGAALQLALSGRVQPVGEG